MIVDGSVFMVENILRHLADPGRPDKSIQQRISEAAHEVQRPVFYAVAIIITAYLPIFTLQRVEGRLFRPMAWTVAFALLGALLFALVYATVLSSYLLKANAREWHNPVLAWLTRLYRRHLAWSIAHRRVTFGAATAAAGAMVYLAFGGVIGSESNTSRNQ